MAKHLNKGLKFQHWPGDDRRLFDKLGGSGDIFDAGAWSILSAVTIRNRRYAYSQWLGFLAERLPAVLEMPATSRVTADNVRLYVEALRRNCTETAIAIALQRLHLTLIAMDPEKDWSWLYRLQRRIAKRAKPLQKQHVFSVDLYQVGIQLMEEAKSKSILFERVVLSQAEQYRDGLMIALLSEAPMRRAGFTRLCLGDHVVKVGERWCIYLQPAMVKTRMAESYEVSKELSRYIDDYIDTYRCTFPDSDKHRGMWPYGDRPMTDKMVRRYLRKHTEQRVGCAVSPHGFRRAAATFLATADPKNARAAKDLLGHTTFQMTEKHYVVGARSRLAGRALAGIVGAISQP